MTTRKRISQTRQLAEPTQLRPRHTPPRRLTRRIRLQMAEVEFEARIERMQKPIRSLAANFFHLGHMVKEYPELWQHRRMDYLLFELERWQQALAFFRSRAAAEQRAAPDVRVKLRELPLDKFIDRLRLTVQHELEELSAQRGDIDAAMLDAVARSLRQLGNCAISWADDLHAESAAEPAP